MAYSALKLIKETLTGHQGWKPVWRKATPKKEYDIVIVCAGGPRHRFVYHVFLKKDKAKFRVSV